MGVEIERKFLVANDEWRANADAGTLYQQGYLSIESAAVVRVRIAKHKAWLTLKGATSGISRAEFEYEIPIDDASQMLDSMCVGAVVEKTRYCVTHANRTWEIDVFSGDNQGLVVAEVELESERATINKPGWVGEEVSADARYFNAALSSHPYNRW